MQKIKGRLDKDKIIGIIIAILILILFVWLLIAMGAFAPIGQIVNDSM